MMKHIFESNEFELLEEKSKAALKWAAKKKSKETPRREGGAKRAYKRASGPSAVIEQPKQYLGVWLDDEPDREQVEAVVKAAASMSETPLGKILKGCPKVPGLAYTVARNWHGAHSGLMPLSFAEGLKAWKKRQAASQLYWEVQELGGEEIMALAERLGIIMDGGIYPPLGCRDAEQLVWFIRVMGAVPGTEGRTVNSPYYHAPNDLMLSWGSSLSKIPVWAAGVLWKWANELWGHEPRKGRYAHPRKLLSAAKALKVRRGDGYIPLSVVAKVGKMSPLARIIAGRIPFRSSHRWDKDAKIWRPTFPDGREAAEAEFFGALKSALENPHNFLYEWAMSIDRPLRPPALLRTAVSLATGVPWDQVPKNALEIAALLLARKFGRAAQKALGAAESNSAAWAAILAPDNPGRFINICGEPDLLPAYWDSIRQLSALPYETAIRLLRQRLFRRGERKHWVTDDLVRDTMMLWDEAKAYPEDLRRVRVREWYSWHEDLAKIVINNQPQKTLIINNKFNYLDGMCSVDGKWELRFPYSTRDLVLWGKIMDNCIGGYTGAVNSGQSIILGLFDHKTQRIEYGLELSPLGSIRQLRGFRNCEAEGSAREFVKFCLGLPQTRITPAVHQWDGGGYVMIPE